MDFRFTPEQETFRKEVQEFIARETTPELLKEMDPGLAGEASGHGPHTKAFIKRLGQQGWLGLAWPKEYGGQGRSMIYQFILVEELSGALVPTPGLTLTSVGPTIMRVANEEIRGEFLPGILRGDIEFAIGYTEPGAGSDLASLQTRAVRDGDDYVINGQKMFTTDAHHATHVWLLTRTDTEVRKHRGISMFIVPLDTPGISVRPLWHIGEGRTNETFYDNVRVPARYLVGEENMGWYYAAMALDYERVGVAPFSRYVRTWRLLVDFCKETAWDSKPLIADPWVRSALAQMGVEVEAARLLAYRTAWMIDQGQVPNYEASAQKVFATELVQRMANTATQILGLYAQLMTGSKWAPTDGKWERLYRSVRNRTVGGGSSQMQRNIIALRGLGLPRG
ncbi:MAG: acyl-CoA dehydrogenase family protein [Chloroflexi bacterium]|nr:acyl-CoA dehydrogenase family protein [Chloroflexota bacterium]